ncbi:MAG: M23 family metallopeptidase [Nitrospirota bacterium]
MESVKKQPIVLILLLFSLLAGCCGPHPVPPGPSQYIWPLSGSTTPDEMNTSFGPRINYSKWDFHDGLDLPADIATTTPIYAVHAGIIYKAGDADYHSVTNPNGYHSRHIVLEVNDADEGVLYAVYIHLESIDSAVTVGASVTQGQALGTAGSDGATYKHLHFEIRKGSPNEINSVHPLYYLPYTDTPNFTAPVLDRANLKGTSLSVRLSFGAISKREGDLKRVEVDMMNGATLLSTRIVDFNDKTTINDTIGDEHLYVNDIGVEGYQTSDMVLDGRTDLQYGILVRNLPVNCDILIARIIDVGGRVVTSAPIAVPARTAFNLSVDFEDGLMPPTTWSHLTSSSGSGTTVVNDSSAAKSGLRGMLATDASAIETTTQRAAIEMSLPIGRFEWKAESDVNPMILALEETQAVYPLYFLNDSNLVAAARVYKSAGTLFAGIAYKKTDGTVSGVSNSTVIAPNIWKKWTLSLLRVGTRETTAVLYLDDVEQDRVSWDPGTFPSAFRSGIGLSSRGALATLAVDNLQITE